MDEMLVMGPLSGGLSSEDIMQLCRAGLLAPVELIAYDVPTPPGPRYEWTVDTIKE